MDGEYRRGFAEGLEVALNVLRKDPDAGFGEIAELVTRVRLGTAEKIVLDLRAAASAGPGGTGSSTPGVPPAKPR